MKKTLLLCLILLAALFALSVTALADADPNDYLTFTDDGSTGGSFTITLKKSGNPNPVSLQYRTWDGSAWGGWTNYTVDDAISGVTKIQFNRVDDNGNLSGAEKGYYFSFASGNKVTVSGNIMTLLGASYRGNSIPSSYCFDHLFASCRAITSANELLLPATTLAKNCYSDMFFFCSSLTAAPTLPATALAEACYRSMFSSCLSLTAAPALPATTLTETCYGSMFSGCTSLTAAPELPATTLKLDCYGFMFDGCTSLTTIPGGLPANTMEGSCCCGMFLNCTNLPVNKVTDPDIANFTLADGDTVKCMIMFQGTQHDENVADSPAAGMYMIGLNQGSVGYTIDAGSWDGLKNMKISITLSNDKTYTDDQTLNAHFSALDPSLFVGEFRFYVNVLNVPGTTTFKSATLVA